MDSTIVGALIALGGVIVGGIATGIAESVHAKAAFRREKGWERNEQHRARLEELFMTLEQFSRAYQDGYTEVLHIIGTQTAPPPKPTVEAPWPRLTMLIALHFPQFFGHLTKLESARHQMSAAIAGGIMESSADKAKNAGLVRALDLAHASLTGETAILRAAIVAESKALSTAAVKSLASG